MRMRDGSIGSWVRGTISPLHGGDEDDDLTGAISNSIVRSLSLSLSVCTSVSPFSLSFSLCSFFLSLRVFGNDLKVKQKLKIFSRSKGLFYGQSK